MEINNNNTMIPAVRHDLFFEQIEGDKLYVARLVDPIQKISMKIDRKSMIVIMSMDKEQPFSSLVLHVKEATEIEDDTIKKILSFLDQYHLTITRDNENYLDKLVNKNHEDEKTPSDLKLIIPDDLFFECTSCGGCCGFHNIGPVENRVVDMLKSDSGKQFLKDTGVKNFLIKFQKNDEDEPVNLFKLENQHCTFLDNQAFCTIHNKFGYDKKPLVCRLFPIQFTRAPEGIYVGLQMECRDYFNAKRLGKKIGRKRFEQNVRSLISQFLHDNKCINVHDTISVDFLNTIPYSTYIAAETKLLEGFRHSKFDYFFQFPLSLINFFKKGLENSYEKNEFQIDDFTREFNDFFIKVSEKMKQTAQDFKKETGLENDPGIDEIEQFLDSMKLIKIYGERIAAFKLDSQSAEYINDFYRNFFFIKESLQYRNLLYAIAWLSMSSFFAMVLGFHKATLAKRVKPLPEHIMYGFIQLSYFSRHRLLKDLFGSMARDIILLFFEHFDKLPKALKEMEKPESKTFFYHF